jgi:hypothetical protein
VFSPKLVRHELGAVDFTGNGIGHKPHSIPGIINFGIDINHLIVTR